MRKNLCCKQRVELAGFLERVEVVTPAHMRVADEDLRKRACPIRLLDHLGTQLAFAGRVDFLERDTFARQQLARRFRVIAEIPRVDHNFSHIAYASLRISEAHYMGAFAASTTRANTRTSTWTAPARSSARAQASDVAPEVSTSSMTMRRRPAISALAERSTRNAPCTLVARSVRESPTCCAVAFTRRSAVWVTGNAVAREMTWASAADWLK